MSGDLSGFSMMDLFRMEAESHTATLSAGLVAIEGASAAPEVIEPLMRGALAQGSRTNCRSRCRCSGRPRNGRLLRGGAER